MNVLQQPQVQAKGRDFESQPIGVQDALGANLEMTPEMLALLKKEGKVSEGEFQALLQVLSKEGDQAKSLFGNPKTKENLLKLLKTDNDNGTKKNKEAKLNSKIANKLGFAELMTKQNKMKSQKGGIVSEYQSSMNKSFLSNSNNSLKENSDSKSTSKISLDKVENKTVSLQDLMFSGSSDQEGLDSGENMQQQPSNMKVNQKISSNVVKVFDMSNMDNISDSQEVISKIQDYIIQTKASNEKQVEFSFQHKELGQVGLNVAKNSGDALNIVITTNSIDGAKFFTQNQGELLSSLSQAGIQVGDFKLDSSKASSNQDFGSDSSKQFAGNNKDERGSESGERQKEQERRQTLWDEFSQDQVAA